MFAAVVGLRLWVVYWCVPQVTGRRLWAWWPRLPCCLHVSLHTSVWVWAASFLDGWEFWTTVISVQCYLLLMFCWRHVHCTSSYVFIGHSPTHCLSVIHLLFCLLAGQSIHWRHAAVSVLCLFFNSSYEISSVFNSQSTNTVPGQPASFFRSIIPSLLSYDN